jgi:hypothetical protein
MGGRRGIDLKDFDGSGDRGRDEPVIGDPAETCPGLSIMPRGAIAVWQMRNNKTRRNQR